MGHNVLYCHIVTHLNFRDKSKEYFLAGQSDNKLSDLFWIVSLILICQSEALED